jgi:hypothetical protein
MSTWGTDQRNTYDECSLTDVVISYLDTWSPNHSNNYIKIQYTSNDGQTYPKWVRDPHYTRRYYVSGMFLLILIVLVGWVWLVGPFDVVLYFCLTEDRFSVYEYQPRIVYVHSANNLTIKQIQMMEWWDEHSTLVGTKYGGPNISSHDPNLREEIFHVPPRTYWWEWHFRHIPKMINVLGSKLYLDQTRVLPPRHHKWSLYRSKNWWRVLGLLIYAAYGCIIFTYGWTGFLLLAPLVAGVGIASSFIHLVVLRLLQ